MIRLYNSHKRKYRYRTLDNYLYTAVVCTMCLLFLLYFMLYHDVDDKHEHTHSEQANMHKHDQPNIHKHDYQEREHVKDFEYTVPPQYHNYDEDYEDTISESEEGGMASEEVERMESIMAARKERAEMVCRRNGENLNGEPNGWEYFINYDHHIIWCNVFKAASTSWFRNFMMMAGHSGEQYQDLSHVDTARLVYHRPTGEELKEAHQDPDNIAFIIVRHPFERLSSAFRDKIQNRLLSDPYDEIADEIVEKFRKEPPNTQDKNILQDSTPTFEEFVRYILHEASLKHPLDMHWVPYSKFCTPCQMHFDVIVKFETYEEDINYLLYLAALDDVLPYQKLNDGGDKRVDNGKTTKEIVKDHYSQLTVRQVSQLYELYVNDFEIFDYSPEDYYNMAI